VSLAFYSSPEALAAHCSDESVRSGAWHDAPWSESWDSFTQSRDMDHAVSMARDGWPEGAQRAAALRDKVLVNLPMERRATTFAVAGAYPHVQRAIAGNPASMYRLDTTASRRRPVITLISDMCVRASTSADCLTNRAAVVAAIIDAIEAAGYACNVVGYCSSRGNGVRWATIVNLKESHQPADIGRLAFGLGHAAMFRRLCWVPAMEHNFTRAVGVGLGKPQGLDSKGLPEFTYVLPSADDDAKNFGTEERAAVRGLDRLVRALQDQGCPALPPIQEAA